MEDPSGNSFIQNPNAPNKDVYMKTEFFPRTTEDYVTMGYNEDASREQSELDKQKFNEQQPNTLPTQDIHKAIKKVKGKQGQTKEEQESMLQKFGAYAKREQEEPEITASNVDFSKPLDQQEAGEAGDVKKEVLKFPTCCYACGREGDAQMCMSSIPFFKEIIIMAFSCEYCGYRNTEIKHGGGMSDHATKIVFKVLTEKDLNRDLFKSDSCSFEIPELEFEMAPGSLDSMYTTVEGLLDKLHDSLKENNPFGMGDSAANRKYMEFLDSLKELQEFKRGPFTIIMDDAISNCFIYNPNAPEADP